MKVIEKMSGRKIVRAETSGDRFAEKQDEAHEDRLVELRIKAVIRLRWKGADPLMKDITQVGCDGFYWRSEGQVISKFEPWSDQTVIENRRIFNAHT